MYVNMCMDKIAHVYECRGMYAHIYTYLYTWANAHTHTHTYSHTRLYTDDMRLKRLRKMELAQLEMNDGAKGSAADFQRIMQQEVEDELRKATENALEAEKIGE